MAVISTSGYLEQAALAAVESASPTSAPIDVPSESHRFRNDVATHSESVGQGQMICAGDWTAQAMCRGKTAIFFAPPGEREGRRKRREALACAYCAVCPVRDLCGAAGREGREHGIWGGENDEERAVAGFAPRSPHRRAIAQAAREARNRAEADMELASDIGDDHGLDSAAS